MTPDYSQLGVSRETTERLQHFANLVRKWSPRINLVSKRDLQTLEDRHIADSLQLVSHLKDAKGLWADLGSGGGFPAIVLAIAARGRDDLAFHLVESDQRKSTFLRTAIRELDLNAKVEDRRIEDIPPLAAQRISARALAPLDALLGYAARHLAPDGQALFLKGRDFRVEIEAARRSWHFDLDIETSQTDPAARLLIVSNLHHA